MKVLRVRPERHGDDDDGRSAVVVSAVPTAVTSIR